MENLEIKNLAEKITQNILKNSILHSPYRKDLPNFIQVAINYKRRLRTHWKSTRDPATKSALNPQIQEVRDLFHTFREDDWTNFWDTLASNEEDWQKLYKLNRKLLRHFDLQAKSKIFVDAMQIQFQISSALSQKDSDIREAIAKHNNLPKNKHNLFLPCRSLEHSTKTCKLKTPGPDNIIHH